MEEETEEEEEEEEVGHRGRRSAKGPRTGEGGTAGGRRTFAPSR